MIRQEEYQQRRKKLIQQLPADSVVVIGSAKEILRTGDTEYRFRQNSDYFYLTGDQEPDALLVIDAGKSILFNKNRDPEQELWTGKRLGQEGAITELGMDEAWPLDQIPQKLPEIFKNKKSVYYLFSRDKESTKLVLETIQALKHLHRKGICIPETFSDLEPILGEMRLFKSPAEQGLMRKAASISVEAHKRAMAVCKQVDYEYELEAELMYTFFQHGCKSPAYNPIVGSGRNACILHYTDNNKPIDKNGLILIDAGCEYRNYASDITRTFPANGQFNGEQRALYDLVLQAWKGGIASVKPGIPWNQIQQTIVHILTTGLCELGILKGKVEDCIEKEAYKPFYMHNSGHWLGLDVHDCGTYKVQGNWRVLEPGMVLTVEPGLYISEGIEGVDERWWNMGIRIEDDILVTASGHENLTAALPAEIDDIEALMRG